MHAAYKILNSSEWMLVVSKSCVSLLCWIKKGEKRTKGYGSSRSFSVVAGPCSSLSPVLHWDTFVWLNHEETEKQV